MNLGGTLSNPSQVAVGFLPGNSADGGCDPAGGWRRSQDSQSLSLWCDGPSRCFSLDVHLYPSDHWALNMTPVTDGWVSGAMSIMLVQSILGSYEWPSTHRQQESTTPLHGRELELGFGHVCPGLLTQT